MKRMLNEVDIDNCKLITIEGEEFTVDPFDITICCTWSPTVELEIKTVRGQKVCKNLASGQSIKFI